MPTLQRSLGGFASPEDVIVRPDGGQLVVIETNAHRFGWAALPGAAAFNYAGSYVNGAAAAGMAFPVAGSFDPAGNVVVLDLWNRRVVRYRPQAGGYVFDTVVGGTLTTGGTPLGFARDIAFDNAGTLYLLDSANRRIIRYDGAGTTAVALPNDIAAPWGLALRPGGGFLIVDRKAHKVHGLGATGSREFVFGRFGRDETQLRFPEHAAFSPTGSVWVADSDNHRIVEYTATGAFVRVVLAAQQFRQIRRLRFSAAGDLYVADSGAGSVHEITNAVPAKAVNVSRGSINFGNAGIGYTTAVPVHVDNVGAGAVSINQIAAGSAPFGVDLDGATLPIALAPGARKTIFGTYSPQQSRVDQALITISTDALQNHNAIPVVGTGVAAAPVSVVLVLDRSGSMARPIDSGTKMAALRDAATLFVSLLRRDAGDELAIVSFAGEARTDFALRRVDEQAGTDAGTVLSSLNAAGSTSIGAGLQAGLAQLSLATTSRKVLVVLTDGVENRAPMIADVPMPADVTVYAIGFGEALDLDAGKLALLGGDSSGTMLITEQNDSLLPKFFVQIAADLADEFIVVDPELVLTARDEPQDIELPVTSRDRRLRCVVFWDREGPEIAARLEVVGKGVSRKLPQRDFRRAKSLIVETELPAGLPSAGSHTRVVLKVRRQDKGAKIRVTVVVLARSELRLSVRAMPPQVEPASQVEPRGKPQRSAHVSVGHTVGVIAVVSDRGQPLLDWIDDRSTFEYPTGSLVDHLMKLGEPAVRKAMSAYVRSPDQLSVRQVLWQAGGNAPIKRKVELMHWRREPGPQPQWSHGIAANQAIVSGAYTVHLRIAVRAGDGRTATRERIMTVYVHPEVSTAHSDISVFSIGASGARVRWLARITPRDRFGGLLGPGWGDMLRIEGPSVAPLGVVRDRGDGVYECEFTLTGDVGDRQFGLRVGPSITAWRLPSPKDLDAGWTRRGAKGLDVALGPEGPRKWGRREVGLKE